MRYDPMAKAETTCVRFTVTTPNGTSDAAISAKALVERFGAVMTSASLLKCYRKNFRAIHAAARQQGQPTSDGGVLLTAADLDDWVASNDAGMPAKLQPRAAERWHAA